MSHTIWRKAYQTTTPTGLYEANYRRLMRLVPSLSDYRVKASVTLRTSNVLITILEQFKYTSVIALKQVLHTGRDDFSAIEMELRVCHDASLAEVIGYQGKSPIQSALVYPNRHMLQVDEKKQLNLLLKEILENSIKTECHAARLISPCN